jgi:hypothetical protein
MYFDRWITPLRKCLRVPQRHFHWFSYHDALHVAAPVACRAQTNSPEMKCCKGIVARRGDWNSGARASFHPKRDGAQEASQQRSHEPCPTFPKCQSPVALAPRQAIQALCRRSSRTGTKAESFPNAHREISAIERFFLSKLPAGSAVRGRVGAYRFRLGSAVIAPLKGGGGFDNTYT